MNPLAAPRPTTPADWRSLAYAAKFFGRTEQRIRQWCATGRFAALGIPVFQDRQKRWWILLERS
jgi:hypothetical protein